MTNEQQRLFDEESAPWEEADAAERFVAAVVFSRGPGGAFDYAVPDRLREVIAPGQRVRVPLGRGNRPITGYCVGLEHRQVAGGGLKELIAIVDERALLSPAMLRLTRRIAEHYLCPWGQVLEAVIPAGVRGQAGTRLAPRLSLAEGVAARLPDLKLSPKQTLVMERLAAARQPMAPDALAREAGCTQGPIRALRRRGLIVARQERVSGEHAAEAPRAEEPNLVLNVDQQAAMEAIHAALESGAHETILLHGVTGSGKTEVYIRAIQEVVRFGRQAIVLVPEISLTPQTRQRFRARFPEVAVLHSHLSDVERHAQWRRIAEGRAPVIVGARSAVFAPTPQLGLLVLDEEHESSFKQETAPRYHARDAALERARAEGVPLVLGSATPSLESWRRAAVGEYRLIELPKRVSERPLPDVSAVDLRAEMRDRRSRGAISRRLHLAMETALSAGGQVILLLNRRGFSTHIQCPACGAAARCPHCSIALTHHLERRIALCHYCDYEIPAPQVCDECRFEGLRYGGLGTQKLEREVQARFPDHRCLRMDTDSMRKAGSHEQALAKFHSGEVRILVGTQMIAKGLDFPNVTLVGVVNADTVLHFPDFRAAERTVQLLVQVAGRTGRGEKGGRVLVQTFSPDHPAIRSAMRHDYAGFAERELAARAEHGYPPPAAMIRFVVRGPGEPLAEAFAAQTAEALREALARAAVDARVLGPAPAPIPKLRDKFRFQIQMQGPNGEALREAARRVIDNLRPPEGVEWIVDVDPLDML